MPCCAGPMSRWASLSAFGCWFSLFRGSPAAPRSTKNCWRPSSFHCTSVSRARTAQPACAPYSLHDLEAVIALGVMAVGRDDLPVDVIAAGCERLHVRFQRLPVDPALAAHLRVRGVFHHQRTVNRLDARIEMDAHPRGRRGHFRAAGGLLVLRKGVCMGDERVLFLCVVSC